MTDRTKESERYVAALLSAFEIIECFQTDEGLQLKELHHLTGINKSKIMRLAGSMEACNLLVCDRETRSYSLGPKFYQYGRMVGRRYQDAIAAVDSDLMEITRQTGGASYVSVRYRCDRLVISRRNRDASTERGVRDGQVRPLYRGPSSIVLLANESDSERLEIFQKLQNRPGVELEPAEMEVLNENARKARADGYALGFGTTKPNHHVVSVPLVPRHGGFMGALGLSLPSCEQTPDHLIKHVALLQQASRRFYDTYVET